MPAQHNTTLSSGCQGGAGFLSIDQYTPFLSTGPAPVGLTYEVTGNTTGPFASGFCLLADLPLLLTGLPDDTFTVVTTDDDGNGDTLQKTIGCAGTGGGSPGALALFSSGVVQPTATVATGAFQALVNGGLAPRTAVIPGVTTSPVPLTNRPVGYLLSVNSIPAGSYVATISDGSQPAQTLDVPFVVEEPPAPVVGCQDEYAVDYNPEATSAGACTFEPLWRSAWQMMDVRVPAVAGQTEAFITANLRVGFRPGHPLATDRPLGDPQPLRATVGPDGLATFRLGPYLRPQLGTPDGHGGYRLDLNSGTAFGADLYAGYELRRPTGELLEHGYALNAAVPDEALPDALSPFSEPLPVWPGFAYILPTRKTAQGFGVVGFESPDGLGEVVYMPCPLNPLPVAWLAPGSGYGFWVFQGRPQLGDDVGDGQRYSEAGTDETRYSQRGDARRTVTAFSGYFKGRGLMEGLRTLWRSPQVWYKPSPSGPWVPVTLEAGSFPAGRLGVVRQGVTISFTEAKAQWAQGQ